MKSYLWLIVACFASTAQAYSINELRDDCQVADAFFAGQQTDQTQASIKDTRCINYVAGFADGYAISDYLADRVGVRLNAFCLPKEPDLAARLVRAVLAHLEHLPPNPGGSTASLVASALAKSFPCPESLESKK